MADSTALHTDASPNRGESAPERRPVVRASRSARRWASVHDSTRRRRAPRRSSQPAVLQVADLTVRATDGTVILDEVSFSVPRGSVVAIVGPTGAGKTTLLNALTGRLRVQHGSIRVNGEELADNDALRRRLGYVPQDDVLHPQLTLRQTLEHAAALRLPSHVDAHHRAERVTAVLTDLGLEERQHLAISSLSGGQRKRASVAVELLSQPEVLVLDEPTTGLDPGRERSVLASLRSLADLGHTVLTVTHSPQALAECDRVLFLAGGHVAFFGTPATAIDYFGHADAAEVFLALATTPGEAWRERFRAHPLHARSVPKRSPAAPVLRSVDSIDSGEQAHPAPTPPASSAQFRTLVRRCLDVMRSDRRHMVLLALQGPVLGLLLASTLIRHSFRPLVGHASAALSSQHRLDAISAGLFVALSITWLGTANAVREIVKEKRTLLREEGTGLSLSAYVSAKVVALGTVAMLQSAILAVVATAHQDVPVHGAVLPSGVLELAVVGALAGLCAIAIGLMLSALVTSADKALTVLPISLVAQLVFSGAWVPLDGPVFRQLRDLSSVHWAVHAMRATTINDRGDWWLSVFALLVITASAIFATLALVQRRVLPTQIGETTARLGFRMEAGMRPAAIAAGGLLLVLAVTSVAGTTSDFVPRAKLLGVLHHKSTSSETPVAETNGVARLATETSPLPVDITAPPQMPNVPDALAGLAAVSAANTTVANQSTAAAGTAPSAQAAPAPASSNSAPPAGLSPGPGAPAASTAAPPASSTPTDTSSSDAAARQAAWQQWMQYAAANQDRRTTTSTTRPTTTSTTTPPTTSTTTGPTTSTTTRRTRG